MPLPLKPGYNLYIDRKCKPSDYEMSQLEIYRDYYGMSYTVSGNRKFIMPNMIAFLHGGSIGITMKDVYHKTSFVDNTPYERFVLKFTDVVLEPLIKVIGRDTFDELYSYPVYNFTPEIQNKLYHIYCDMLYEYEHYSNESELILSGMLHNLIMTVIRHHLPINPKDVELSETDHSILSAMDYIEHNFLKDPSLSETAKHIGLSSSHFSRIFKQATGVSYSEYLNYIRVEHGRKLLLTTSLSISEIAQFSGFDNGNYFCNVTKKLLGCSPSEIRKSAIDISLKTKHNTKKI